MYRSSCPIFCTRFGIGVNLHNVVYVAVQVKTYLFQYLNHDVAAILDSGAELVLAETMDEGMHTALTEAGVKVFDCGLASTPAMFMSTVFDNYKCDGAIMITASHLPFNRNGFKYFDKDGGLNKEQQTAADVNKDGKKAYLIRQIEVPSGALDHIDLHGTFS